MNFTPSPEEESPQFQIVPLIDIVFLVLIFFMSASIFYQLESELNINIPTASESVPPERTPGKIIINIGPPPLEKIVVNQRELTIAELTGILQRISALYKGQAVIIRADKKTSYDRVIQVLNACAQADIWNISFAAVKREKEVKGKE